MSDFNWPPDVLSLKYGDIQKQYMDVMQCLKCKISPDGRGCLKLPSLVSLSTEELVERFLLLFVLDGIPKSDIFKSKFNIDKQPLCDILTSETQALISEVLSYLQKSLMQDRIFYQHGVKIICDSIRHCLYSFDNIKITGPDSAKWYQALLDYKRSGIMTSKERTESMQELSFEAMDKICEGVEHRLETQSSLYYNLDSKGRYIFQRDLQLTPLKFFLATYLAKNERPDSSGTCTPKFDAIMDYICGENSEDIYDIDNKCFDFFFNEMSQKYHYKTLSKRDLGYTTYVNIFQKAESKRIRLTNENSEKIGKYSKISSSWDSSGEDRTFNKDWDKFFQKYRIKCLDAFDQITRKCRIYVAHDDKSTASEIVPNYSLNLIAFDQVTQFVWLTDLWIAKHTYLSSAFENMPTSNIKAALRDYSMRDWFDFDSDGIALLGMCINLPIDVPKCSIMDCDPYCNYVKNQQNLIFDLSKREIRKAPIPHPQLSPGDETHFIWI